MDYNFLLCGHTGLLGQCLYPLLPITSLCPNRAELDLENLTHLQRYLFAYQPRIIINAAGYTAVDQAEQHYDHANRINHEAVAVMANYAAKTGALLVHFSTDYVFDGTKNTPYLESDKTRPINQYGKTKCAGEYAILHSGCNHLIFRIGWLYGQRGHHFARTILERAQTQTPLYVVDDQIGTPTPVEWIGPIIYQAIKTHQSQLLPSGIYHLSPQGQCSWYEFARALLPLDYPIQPTTQQQHPRPALRPNYSVLGTQALMRAMPFDRPHWRTLLTHFFPVCPHVT